MNLDSAEKLLTKIAPIVESWYGVDNYRLATFRLAQCSLAIEKQEWTQANELAQDAIDRYLQTFPNDHFYVANGQAALAESLLGHGNHAKALESCDRAIEITSAIYGIQSYRLGSLRSLRGRILQSQGNTKAAVEELLAAISIREKSFGADSHITAISESHLGESLITSDDLKGAEDRLRHALKVLEGVYPPGDRRVQRTAGNLAKVLEATARADKATELRRKYSITSSAAR